MPSILITNLYLISNSGSELHATEVAKYFAEKGWNVACFCVVAAEPVAGLLRHSGITVLDLEHADQLDSHYDVLFAQHRVASEFVWNHANISFDKIVVSILGLPNVTKHEALPSFCNDADLIIFISEEARQAAFNTLEAANLPPSVIFPNYYTSEFENYPAKQLPQAPSRIAVVSNHIVPELEELETIAASKNIAIDYYGIQHISVPITPALLSRHDVVITIGRTVPAALSLGIPVYCYDHFGGPGYIVPENFDACFWHNFSGRNCPIRKEAKAVLDEIVNRWDEASADTASLRQRAREQLSFATLMEDLATRIVELPSDQTASEQRVIDAEKIHQNFSECLEIRSQQLTTCKVGQIFYVPENNPTETICETASVKFLYRLNTEIELNIDELADGAGLLISRLDPADEGPCICSKRPVRTIASNSSLFIENIGDVFLTNDPVYELNPCKTVSFCASEIDSNVANEISHLLETYHDQIGELEMERDILMRQTNSIRFGIKNLAKLIAKRILH